MRIVTNSLQFRLISAFCLISILPLVFINLMSYYNTTGIVQENTDELAEVNLVQTDKSVRSTLAAYEDLLFQLYTGDDIVNDVDELNAGGNEALAVNQLRRTLRGIANIKDSIQCITIITESGDIIFYDKPTASSIKNSWLDTMNLTPEELYDKISNENSTQYITTRYASSFSAKPYYLFHLAHRIVDYNSIHRQLGVIIISIDERLLHEVCNQNSVDGDDTLPGNVNFIVDDEGRLVTFPVQRSIENTVLPIPESENGWRESYGELIEGSGLMDGDNFAIHSLRDDLLGWSFVNVSDQSVVFRQIEAQRNLMLLAVFLSVAFLIAVIILVTRHMTGSIKNIVAAMKKAGAGDLAVRVRRDRKMPSEMETITDQFNRMMGQMNKLVEEVKMVSARQKDAEITALEAQINPHFLYNTLDTINWMAINADQYEISSAIGALARILRYGIDKSNSIVTLREEMEWLQQYIFLQQTRLKNTFSCQIIVPPELLDCLIHKLIFQPFVENAILHGFEGVQQHHILIIEIQEKPKGLLNITIHDNGKGIEAAKVEEIKQGILPDNKSKNHLGMKNAIDRLKMYYGEDAEFIIESPEGKGTTLVIRIPKTQGRE